MRVPISGSRSAPGASAATSSDLAHPVASPCIGLCRIEPTQGLCGGCARTGDEIARWGLEPGLREQVWRELPARRLGLGLGLRRPGWTLGDIRGFVVGSLRAGGGTWVSGPDGAAAGFAVGEDERVAVDSDGETVLARTGGGAIAFRLSHHLRALAVGAGSGPPENDVVVLALPREHLAPRRGGRPVAPLSAPGVVRHPLGWIAVARPAAGRAPPAMPALPRAYVACVAHYPAGWVSPPGGLTG